MEAKKLDFAHDVILIVDELCDVVFNINPKEQLKKIFGINHEQMESVIKKIINVLPDEIFQRGYLALAEEVKNICAREFIFFQVQEKWDDPHYQEDLLNFIKVFSRDIQQRIHQQVTYQSKMKEE